jgi:hypothetical protein
MDDVPTAIDVTGSEKLRKLADEIDKSEIPSNSARGDTPIASVTPRPEPTATLQRRKRRNPERVLDIIGIGSSGGSNVARFKDDYIADAVDHCRA